MPPVQQQGGTDASVRSTKTAAGVLCIVSGALMLLASIICIVVFSVLISEINNGDAVNVTINNHPATAQELVALTATLSTVSIILAFYAMFCIAKIVIGSMFLCKGRNKGQAITLIVLCALNLSVLNIAAIVFLAIYLSKISRENNGGNGNVLQ